jgi:hypothetical protein
MITIIGISGEIPGAFQSQGALVLIPLDARLIIREPDFPYLVIVSTIAACT